MQLRVLIDIEVGVLLTFLVSMKANIHVMSMIAIIAMSVSKCVSIFGCLHVKSLPFFKYPVFKVSM